MTDEDFALLEESLVEALQIEAAKRAKKDDDIAPEYDFPDLHCRAEEMGRKYKGILSESGRGVLRILEETGEPFRQMTGGGTTKQSLEIADEMLEDTTSSE